MNKWIYCLVIAFALIGCNQKMQKKVKFDEAMHIDADQPVEMIIKDLNMKTMTKAEIPGCFCFMQNEKLTIGYINDGIISGYGFMVNVDAKNQLNTKFGHWMDGVGISNTGTTVAQKLTLNNPNYKVGSTIIGAIDFTSQTYNNIDTTFTQITGVFQCTVDDLQRNIPATLQ